MIHKLLMTIALEVMRKKRTNKQLRNSPEKRSSK